MLSSKFSILSVEADVKGRGEPKPLFNDFVTAARTPSLGSVLKNTFINIYKQFTKINKQCEISVIIKKTFFEIKLIL